MQNKLDSLVFISLNENEYLNEIFPDFDPSIPIPVQLSTSKEQLASSAFSKESILSGILTVLAWDIQNPHIEYYRSILLATMPRIFEDLTETGIFQAKNGNFDLAEEIFLSLYGLDPQNNRTILNLALLYDERGENLQKIGLLEDADLYDNAALNWYTRALLSEDPLPDAFYNAAYFFMRQQNFKKAKETFETYITIETDKNNKNEEKKKDAQKLIQDINTHALDNDLYSSAYNLILENKEELALEKIREYLETYPKVWKAWFLLGWALRKLERWQDAKSAFLQSIELGNNENFQLGTAYSDICNELSICCMELGEFSESRTWLETGLSKDCENIKIITNLGVLALKQGKTNEARGFFKTSLEIDPKDSFAQEMLDRLN